jgi:hypothetical protein
MEEPAKVTYNPAVDVLRILLSNAGSHGSCFADRGLLSIGRTRYKRRMALALRIIVMGANGEEI